MLFEEHAREAYTGGLQRVENEKKMQRLMLIFAELFCCMDAGRSPVPNLGLNVPVMPAARAAVKVQAQDSAMIFRATRIVAGIRCASTSAARMTSCGNA